MKIKEALIIALKEQEISQYQLSERLGENYNKFNHQLNMANPTVKTLTKWLRAMDCSLIIKTAAGSDLVVTDSGRTDPIHKNKLKGRNKKIVDMIKKEDKPVVISHDPAIDEEKNINLDFKLPGD